MAAHLNTGRLNLGVLRENYRRELLEILDKYAGSKGLVWDEALTGPFGLIAEYTLLKEHEVEKMFPLEPKRLPSSNVQNIVFITRPKLSLMNDVAEVVRKEEDAGGFRKEFHIIFVPRKSLLCEKKLKELGVYGTFTNVEEYALEFIPFDNDLLSMEMDSSFRECYLENDFTSMHQVAKSLMTVQALYGLIPSIYGKGDCAKHVTDMLLRMRREMAGSTCEPQITPQIDTLLLLDRTVDSLTPLLSQLTYEGLIDEAFSIQNTGVKLPPEKFVTNSNQGGPVEVPTEPKKFILNSSEELYAELRDKNFNAVGPVLSKQAKFITAQFDERHSAKTVGEIKQFVSKLPHMQAAKASLATHTSIAELIKEVTDSDDFMECLRCQQEFINAIDTDKPNPFIEDCIAKEEPLIKVLRLICLQCVCNNGFKQKLLDYYKREIIQTYGFQHMITVVNLEKVGLLRLQNVPKTYTTIMKTLNLIVEDVNEQNPTDVAYVFSGYAPISVRLAQHLSKNSWRSIHEMMSFLPGPSISEIQKIPVGLRKRRSSITSSQSSTGDQKVTLVVFLGGVTYAEIAALRFLSQQEDGPTDYIIATTKIINGSSWLHGLCDKLVAKPTNPF